jgi:hypothetical protein
LNNEDRDINCKSNTLRQQKEMTVRLSGRTALQGEMKAYSRQHIHVSQRGGTEVSIGQA